jgi:hypothetical protein
MMHSQLRCPSVYLDKCYSSFYIWNQRRGKSDNYALLDSTKARCEKVMPDENGDDDEASSLEAC